LLFALSNIPYACIFVVPKCIQSTPINSLYSFIYSYFIPATYSIGLYPEVSARHSGISSKASANALTAYYSIPTIVSLYFYTYSEQAISVAPPPPTT
jgi:hypothetical protein